MAFYEDGTILSEVYTLVNELGDSEIDYECGKLMYSAEGLFHRDSGPARVQYSRLGNLLSVLYARSGLEHHEEGPSYIDYKITGAVIGISYAILGTTMTLMEYRLYCLTNDNLVGLEATYDCKYDEAVIYDF